MCQRPGVMGWCYSQPQCVLVASRPWDGRDAAAGVPGPCTGLASSMVLAVAPVGCLPPAATAVAN